jgi:iron complex transport system ATP-binding protein
MELVLDNISVGFTGRVLVSNACAEFAAGTLTTLTGRNGTGKSTLLRVMAGLAKPLSGRILVRKPNGEKALRAGAEIATETAEKPLSGMTAAEISRLIGFVSTERIRVTNLRVRDVVALGRTPHTNWAGRLTDADIKAVNDALELVGITEFAAKPLEELSDGEAQKAMIARVLAQDTPIILLDEPTAFLDFWARREICELHFRLTREREKTIIFSSHDLALADEFADRRIEIASGKIALQP